MHRNRGTSGGPILETWKRSMTGTFGIIKNWTVTKIRIWWNAGKLVTKCANIGGTPEVTWEHTRQIPRLKRLSKLTLFSSSNACFFDSP
jgi:hypothetical protein